MSVATTNNRVEATGNGATTAFPVSFVFNDDTDLKVYEDGTLKTLTTHYTVSGGDGSTGTVTFLAAPANGDAIIILRDPPKTQATSFRNQGRFFAEVHEAAFDKLTMIVQRLSDLLGRAAVLPDTVASTVDPTLPTPSAGGVLSWNSTADGLENGTTVGAINSAAGSAAAAAASATAAQTAQTAAELAETNAETAEANAEAAAAAAQAAADSIGFRDVIFLTSADSPYSVLQATSGKLLSVDTSGGAVTVTLPAIAGLTLPFTVGVKKTTGDANAVTINRSSTDEFDDGSTSKTLSSIAGTTLIPDTDPAPDKWSAADWGASTGQQKKQQFTDGVGFTAGVSTTITITETPLPTTDDALEIFFDGAYQQESEWSYVAATGVVTFGVAIPGGTAKIETVWATPLTIGTPADGTVSTDKLAAGVFNGLTAVAPALGDSLAAADSSDSGNKKKVEIADILGLVRSYLAGLTLSTAGSSATMSIAAGVASDSASAELMSLSSAISKTTSAWAVGTGNGGLDTGTIANSTWYYFYLIRRTDTGVVDVVFSTSSSSPTLPTDYTQYRYIGAGLTDGSAQWVKFTQIGDEFWWDTPVLDYSGAGVVAGALLTCSVPRGRKVKGFFNVSAVNSPANYVYISDPDNADLAGSTTATPLGQAGGNSGPSAGTRTLTHPDCWTDTSAQVRHRATVTNTLYIATKGWLDYRGRMD